MLDTRMEVSTIRIKASSAVNRLKARPFKIHTAIPNKTPASK
jgi:hypothetical protein